MFTAGFAVGTSALELVNIHVEGIAAERFVELALVFLLFSDSTGIDLAGRADTWLGPAGFCSSVVVRPARIGVLVRRGSALVWLARGVSVFGTGRIARSR